MGEQSHHFKMPSFEISQSFSKLWISEGRLQLLKKNSGPKAHLSGESEYHRPMTSVCWNRLQRLANRCHHLMTLVSSSGGLAAAKTTSSTMVELRLEPGSFGAFARKIFLPWDQLLFSERKSPVLFMLKTTMERREGNMPKCEHYLTQRGYFGLSSIFLH